MPKDYYAILGVEKTASYQDIKKAWRDKARQWHPDTFTNEDEKLAAHKTFIKIVEAYSVLIDEKQRAAYDARMASAANTYAGYEHATPEQDQQEAADWFQRVLNESPSEFAKTTLIMFVVCFAMLFLWLGVIGMLKVLYDVITGQSPLGIGGIAMLIIMLIANLFIAAFSTILFKDLYYRMKRIIMWIAMRTQIKRVFFHLFKRKPGRSVAASKNAR